MKQILLTIPLLALLAASCSPQAAEMVITPHPPPVPIGEVYIQGEVAHPGFYPLWEDDTIGDLLQDAGVDLDGEGYPLQLTLSVGTATTTEPQRVDLNRAEAWLLEALPGIGPVKAQAIIDYRTQNAPFKSVYELEKVSGISEETINSLWGLVTVSDQAS